MPLQIKWKEKGQELYLPASNRNFRKRICVFCSDIKTIQSKNRYDKNKWYFAKKFAMRKNLTVTLLIITLTSVSAVKSLSQSMISADSVKSILIKDWERAKEYTQEYMKAMPSAKYSFKATDSVRTFSQQLLHITQANMFLISTATGAKPSYSGPNLEKSTTAQSADSVRFYVNITYDFAINSIKTLPASSLLEPVTVKMGQTITATRLSWLLKAFEHQTHHRGQTTIYLRLAGVHPPNERLF